MKVITSKADLVEALSLVGRAVASRTSVHVLTGVLLEASDEGMTLAATDMEISMRVPLRGRVEAPGGVVMPARLLSEIARTLAGGDVVLTKEATAAEIELRNGGSEFLLRVLPAADFPALPVFPSEEAFVVDKDAFLATIGRVMSAASKDETRPVLTGVLLQVARNVVRMVATDSYRLSVKETPVDASVKDKVQVIVPARCLGEVARVGAATDTDRLTVIPSSNQILFGVGEVLIMSRLIDGQFPNYRQLIPESFESHAFVGRAEFVDALHRVRTLAQKNAPVRLAFEQSSLTISVQSQEVGRAQEALPVRYEGEPLEIGFNPQFLLDGAEAIPEEEIELRFISPLRPGLMRGSTDDFLYLIMPIRLGD